MDSRLEGVDLDYPYEDMELASEEVGPYWIQLVYSPGVGWELLLYDTNRQEFTLTTSFDYEEPTKALAAFDRVVRSLNERSCRARVARS